MIISASRRTDIPAFYSSWFMNRIGAGFCTVPNPFNSHQVSRVSLSPSDVEAIVFWTRNSAPMLPYLKELEQKGFNFTFQYTILGYPRYLDQRGPPLEKSLANFQELASLIGPRRVVWRYDPIVVSQKIGIDYHLQRFDTIARSLQGSTFRCMVSLVDIYRKAKRRLQQVEDLEGKIARFDSATECSLKTLMSGLQSGANRYGMELYSCAETLDLSIHGIFPGKCIDGQYLAEIFGISVSSKKDPGQRKDCGCVVSKDIGMYDSCLLGCQYCYATTSFERAKTNYDSHDPASPSLLGWHEVDIT